MVQTSVRAVKLKSGKQFSLDRRDAARYEGEGNEGKKVEGELRLAVAGCGELQ